MAQNANRSDRDLRKEKKNKQKALQSFLVEKSEAIPVLEPTSAIDPATASDLASTNISEQDEKKKPVQQAFCCICEVDLGDKIRKCGFCNFTVCSEHMRKKRKNKQQNKNVRICDNCEDRYLYSKYMKLELKNEESIAVQETIIEAARQQLETKAIQKRKVMEKHQNKRKEIQDKNKEQELSVENKLKEIKAQEQKLQKNEEQLVQLQVEIKQIEAKLPPDLAEDYRTLELQSQKVNKQIAKYDKLCIDAAAVKAKRERQIYEEYHRWQSTQIAKRNQKPPQDCCIF